MTPYEVPLTNEAQTFLIELGAVTYQLRFYWVPISECWSLDISTKLGEPLISGIPVITGVDLLQPYAYLGFTGRLMVQTDSDPDAVPTLGNLGSSGRVYFVVD